MSEEEIRAEERRINDLRDAKREMLRNTIREIQRGMDRELETLMKSYEAKISEEYRINREKLVDMRAKARGRR